MVRKNAIPTMSMAIMLMLIAPCAAGALGASTESLVSERKVIWSEGGDAPVIECSAMRHCLVELPEGEEVVFALASDAVRWTFEETGYAGRPVIFAKPTECEAMSTALTIGTSMRRYEVVLSTSGCGADASGVGPSERLRFELPGLLVRRAAAPPEPPPPPQVREVVREVEVVHERFHRYAWRAKRRAAEPVEVFDDGERTYVRLSEGAVPTVIGASGAALSGHQENGLLVIGGVHEKLVLRLSGKKYGPRIVIRRVR